MGLIISILLITAVTILVIGALVGALVGMVVTHNQKISTPAKIGSVLGYTTLGVTTSIIVIIIIVAINNNQKKDETSAPVNLPS
jgi:branched-subunit amino acid permease